MTADGVVSVVLIMIAAAVIVYLFVALLDPERF
ncbi:potassium-transporting ATPase subunit F [Rhodococcus sp. P1Y]|nr:potassium-transporting ATPase subunit F [Rhodococcus sp. P1Y]AYJ47714.1 potassium-transporting ATPase subunit F [Rhodococcus sp. P1Y]